VKYKVGDKVRVRDDLIIGKSYGADDFTRGMTSCRGKYVVICGCYERGYEIEGSTFVWTDEMFCSKKGAQLELFP
jgi:hypothetical protein